MKAIGEKNRFILALFLSEALIIGLVDSTLGLVVGVAGAYILTSGVDLEWRRMTRIRISRQRDNILLLSSFQMIL